MNIGSLSTSTKVLKKNTELLSTLRYIEILNSATHIHVL